MEISCRVYKPRRPRESPLYRLVEQHLEELLRVWPARFVRQHGALRPVVERVLRDFLKCGLLEHGFARLWCGECHRSILVAFSCRGRGFCPSCDVPYGANFVEQDMSGWDEMFPTIVACEYPAPGEKNGTPLPDHGEVWPLSWALEPASSNRIRLSVEGRALPYRLTRTLAYNATDTLHMHYELENLGQERIPYMWAAHPQFVCGEGAEILLPPQVTEVCNTIPAAWDWGAPETRFDWPEALNLDGRRVRINRTGPASLKQACKFFVLPEMRAEWAGLIRHPAGDWLRLDWDPDKIPYLGLWIDEGALSHSSVVSLEPTTGFYDSLAVAWEKHEITVLEPGATHDWTLTVRIGTGGQSFPSGLLLPCEDALTMGDWKEKL